MDKAAKIISICEKEVEKYITSGYNVSDIISIITKKLDDLYVKGRIDYETVMVAKKALDKKFLERENEFIDPIKKRELEIMNNQIEENQRLIDEHKRRTEFNEYYDGRRRF